ncbi:MAG: hypothetical protein RLY86_2722 [Pseudomonadota bacterium]
MPSQDRCAELDIAGYSHVPVLFSRTWELRAEAVDYLIAKARGEWITAVAGSADREEPSGYSERARKASAGSLKGIGGDLLSFFDWCEARKADWRAITYDQLVTRYVGDMTSGVLNKRYKGTALAASTINRRLIYVGDFLLFAAKHGWRQPFQIHYEKVRDFRDGKDCFARRGNVRQHPSTLRIPTQEQLSRWLASLREKHGLTPYLMAKTVIRLGLRAEEVILLRVTDLPPVPSDRGKETVEMVVQYGTKGGRDPTDPERKGKARPIRIPVDLLIELHGYVRGHRRLGLKVHQNRSRRDGMARPAPKELFLSRHTGEPLTYSRFHALWTGAAVPYKGYSPHLGRHTWACYTLMEKIQEQARLSTGVDGPLCGIAHAIGHDLIATYIQPQLGHVDQRTSELYLGWVAEMIDLMPALSNWWDALEGYGHDG